MLKDIKTLTREWQEKREETKRELGERTLTMCKKCYTFYYKHSWHFEMPDALEELDRNDKVAVRFKECPACLEQEEAQFESEIDFGDDLALEGI